MNLLRNETETKRSGVRSSLGSPCCVLEQDWIGINTFHDFDSGKQRSFYTFRNRNQRGGGVTCTKVTCMDPEFFPGGGREGAPPDLCESIIGGRSLRPGVFLKKSDEFSSYCFHT